MFFEKGKVFFKKGKGFFEPKKISVFFDFFLLFLPKN